VGVFEGHRGEVRGLVVLGNEQVVSGSVDGELRTFDPYWQSARDMIHEPKGVKVLFVAEDPHGADAIAVDADGGILRERSEEAPSAAKSFQAAGGAWAHGALCGERVALVGSNRLISLFDLESGELARELEGHDGEVLALASDAEGDSLLSGARDRMAILWSGLNANGEERRWVIDHSRAVVGVALAADGGSLATVDSGNHMTLWDVAGRRELGRWKVSGLGGVSALALAPDGQQLAVALKQTVRIYKVGEVAPVAEFGPHRSDVQALVYSHDGRRLVSGDAEGALNIWDVGGAEGLIELAGHGAGITSIRFTGDGVNLLSADSDGGVLAWRSEFASERYERWGRMRRGELRAQRFLEFFGGDLELARERALSPELGLKLEESAVEWLSSEQAAAAAKSADTSEGDG